MDDRDLAIALEEIDVTLLPKDVRRALLGIRDALVEKDVPEAYYLLYQLCSDGSDDSWKPLEDSL